MYRNKTHGQIIGAEFTEGLSHIGTAVAEAGRAAAEQLAPRVEAARGATGPALEAAQRAVLPKVAAAAAVAAPAMASAREAVGPRLEAAREAAAPALEAATKAFDAGLVAAVGAVSPRVEALREGARPAMTTAVTAAQARAAHAAADLAPRVEALQRAAQQAAHDLATDVVPRLTAAQTAALTHAVPLVMAARESLGNVRDELTTRGLELTAVGAAARKGAAKRGRALRTEAARTAAHGGSTATRWPWLVAAVAVAAGAAVALRRKQSDDLWNPAPTGDGPVPSYREDPVPSSPNDDTGKTVSTAQTTAGDATPPDSDLGSWAQQSGPGDVGGTNTPGTATTTPPDPALDTATAAPDDQPQTGVAGIGSGADDERNPASS